QAFDAFGVEETLDWMASHGIAPVVLEGYKVFPRSLQAGSVVDQLRFALEEAGVTLIADCRVEQIQKDNLFELSTNQGVIQGKKVLIATGGMAGLKKNQSTNGYKMLEALGHRCTPLYPAIVQLTTEKDPIRPLKGIKVDGWVTAYAGEDQRKEYGEILFTEYGISGPPVLQVSGFLSSNKGNRVVLDVMPQLTFGEIKEEISRRCKAFANRTCEELLTGFINKRLGQTLIKLAGVEKLSRSCGSLTPKEQSAIAGLMKNFSLQVTGTNGWQQAQVTCGGIETKEFCQTTMESKKVKGLFAAGEVLNVTGDCGGFNLQWAWTSGVLAGRAMAERRNL
ncbi:MAG: aminoacetone oxidase family FAD-binding enzyme, partial [Clostridia bacterium]|nr:aminoacetone oxidase family FAD-binding enzyme [Clostridia bacterium]